MGGCISHNGVSDVDNRKFVSLSLPSENEAELKTLKLKFMVLVDTVINVQALAETRSDEGYILKEDFFKFFNLPGLLGGWEYSEVFHGIERLFNIFDENRNEKIYWTEFKNGVQMCMYGGDEQLNEFIFHFFDLSELFLWYYIIGSDSVIDFVEFRSIMNHLPPSIFFVTLKSAENRSDAAVSTSLILFWL